MFKFLIYKESKMMKKLKFMFLSVVILCISNMFSITKLPTKNKIRIGGPSQKLQKKLVLIEKKIKKINEEIESKKQHMVRLCEAPLDWHLAPNSVSVSGFIPGTKKSVKNSKKVYHPNAAFSRKRAEEVIIPKLRKGFNFLIDQYKELESLKKGLKSIGNDFAKKYLKNIQKLKEEIEKDIKKRKKETKEEIEKSMKKLKKDEDQLKSKAAKLIKRINNLKKKEKAGGDNPVFFKIH